MKRLLLFVLVTAFLLLAGCSGFTGQKKVQEKIISNSQAYNSNKSFPDEIPPLEPIPGETNKPGQTTTTPTAKPNPTPKATPPPGGYDWLMSVDDNVTMLTSEMEQASMKKTFEENTDMIFDGPTL